MLIDFLLQVFEQHRTQDAIVWHDRTYSYDWLLEQVRHCQATLTAQKIPRGVTSLLEADFSPASVAMFLALAEHAAVLVPLTSAVGAQKPAFTEIAQGEVVFGIGMDDQTQIQRLSGCADHELYQRLRQRGHPGLVLFSSGSTGKSKAAVHDLALLLEKFKVRRHSLRTVSFLLYDHIGGVNTMLYTLANAGCLVTVQSRDPDSVLAAVAKHRVELLPTSPTFLTLVLLSEAYKRYDLLSLKTITYGTEPMSEHTLTRFHELFPQIQLQQTYGLSEVGILRSKSKSSDSLWVKLGGEGFQTRVVDGILQIKAQSAMLGYLNAPNPFTVDGWLNTGDAVEVDGEYFRILGRKSEIINVGGEKVFPAEVENILQQMDGVANVTVFGERNPIMGQVVAARFQMERPEPLAQLRVRVRAYCQGKLAPYKIPVYIDVSETDPVSPRIKKIRSVITSSAR